MGTTGIFTEARLTVAEAATLHAFMIAGKNAAGTAAYAQRERGYPLLSHGAWVRGGASHLEWVFTRTDELSMIQTECRLLASELTGEIIANSAYQETL